jgi:membrane protease YdiL (CAAX protease family)
MTRTVNQLSIGRQIFYHLIPGALVTLAYIFFAKYFHDSGLPSVLGFFTASIMVLFPLQIGLPIYIERKRQPGIKLKDIFVFREKIPAWQLVALALGIFLWTALVFIVGGSPLDDPLRGNLFGWVPDWFEFGYFMMNSQEFSRTTMILTWCLGVFFGAVAGPMIEEFYFRSYLLPRMAFLKAWAPFVGGVLMCLYHFWSPWQFFVRLITILPLMYIVWWKRNVYIGVVFHCLGNLIADWLLSIPLVL